ncbi:hypothetical protein H0H93_008557 [Arthromyces matolae]|nr:hypothetical protein H0H93_008557 [Arthromyces matolae]
MDLMHKYSKCNSLDINASPEYQPYFKGFYQEHNHSFCLYRLWITSRVPLEFLRAPEGNDAGRDDGEYIQTFKRQDVFLAFDEDSASVWNGDRVGLRPLDSATNISDNGENESSDDEGEEGYDEDEDEERRSLFDARLRRWIGGVGPSQAFEEPMEGAL